MRPDLDLQILQLRLLSGQRFLVGDDLKRFDLIHHS